MLQLTFNPGLTLTALLYLAYRGRSQSGAEKDNGLLFREQKTLLFFKSKMAEVIFSQSGGELRIQDGGAHESRPCWKTTH